MKFYKRYPGDLMKKTAGLTMAQMGAYDRLMDWCYANEQPVDPEEVFTITHAQSTQDKRDVAKVLSKFFILSEDGYRQERVDEEIADALPRIEAARENGKKGGRPPKQKQEETKEKPSGLAPGTEEEPRAKTNQSQNKEVSKTSSSHPRRSGGRFGEFWQSWPKSERKQDKAKCEDHWTRNELDARADTILADIAVKAKTTKWQGGFIEAPLVYLRGKRWEDGVTPDGSANAADWRQDGIYAGAL